MVLLIHRNRGGLLAGFVVTALAPADSGATAGSRRD